MPGRRRAVGEPGWPTAGTLVATDPDCQSLSCLDLIHAGGAAGAQLSEEFAGLASVVSGADHLEATAHLAVDLRWEPMDEGTVVAGAVHVEGMVDHTLVVVVTEEDHGMWELSPAAVDGIHEALEQSTPPSTLAELLVATAVSPQAVAASPARSDEPVAINRL